MEPLIALQILYNASILTHQSKPSHNECEKAALLIEAFIKETNEKETNEKEKNLIADKELLKE